MYSLCNGTFFDGQDDTVLALNAHHGRPTPNGLHGVFYLQQVSVGTKNGNGTIVRHTVVVVVVETAEVVVGACCSGGGGGGGGQKGTVAAAAVCG